MILTIPVSSADYRLLPKLAQVLIKFGPYSGFKCAVFPTKAVEQDTRKFAAEINPLFTGGVHIEPVELGISGWPLASGVHFRLVAHYVNTNHPHDPWYFFEADNTPLTEDWLKSIEAEFLNSGKAFMGRIVPTRGWRIQQDGRRVPSEGPPHMVGTGIYHPSFFKKSLRLSTVERVMPWAQDSIEPFDVALRDEIVPHAHGTGLIQHNWQTVNYRMEDGKLVCDDAPNIAPENSHKQTWDGMSKVIHGCKDGTLADLVLSGAFSPKTQKAVALPPPPVVSQIVPSLDKPDEKPPLLSFLAVRAAGKVRESKTKYTIKALAKDLEVSQDELIKACGEIGSGLSIAGVAKWVSLA